MAISIARVQTDDREINQLQNNILSVVVPAINSLQSTGASTRADMFKVLGIWVGSTAPSSPITYAAWVAGGTGYWAWIQV